VIVRDDELASDAAGLAGLVLVSCRYRVELSWTHPAEDYDTWPGRASTRNCSCIKVKLNQSPVFCVLEGQMDTGKEEVISNGAVAAASVEESGS
jgi:hypothetical protein